MSDAFQVTQMSGSLFGDDSYAHWSPVDTYVISADMIKRGDMLSWYPKWTKVNFAIPSGDEIQVSTRDYGSLALPAGLMVMVNRPGGVTNERSVG